MPVIEIPVVFISVPFQGISAEDSEALLVKPLEQELSELKGLKKISSTASEGYAGIALEFDYNWNREATLADIRDKATKAESKFPDGAEQYSINEINFSEFPKNIGFLSSVSYSSSSKKWLLVFISVRNDTRYTFSIIVIDNLV